MTEAVAHPMSNYHCDGDLSSIIMTTTVAMIFRRRRREMLRMSRETLCRNGCEWRGGRWGRRGLSEFMPNQEFRRYQTVDDRALG